MYKVLISDKLSKEALEVFAEYKDIQADFKVGMTPEELAACIGGYDALAVRSETKATKDILDAATKIKVIGRAGIGVDNIDTKEATKRGIVVMNTPGGNTITTAEHTISMMLSLARKIPQANYSMKNKKWEKSKFMGTEVFNKTLGIIGIGNIGSIVADRARGLKMKVVAYDPFISQEKAEKLGIELVSLDDLYHRADFISVHTPLTQDTKNLVNKDAFAKMKDGVHIINCARGGIICEADLAEAIKAKKVKGAALDVYEKEPPDFDKELYGLDEVTLTPHLGASTLEAQVNVSIAIARQIAEYLVNGTITDAINIPAVSREALHVMGPYINLGEKLGLFLGQIAGTIKSISIEYRGEVASLGTKPLTTAILKGLLSKLLDEPVNFVNAPFIAKDRGLTVNETTASESVDFSSVITLSVTTDAGVKSVSGALFGKSEPRIVRVNTFLVDAIPVGNLLVIENNDKPGVIGLLGTVLGAAGINIGRMHIGREEGASGKAIALLNVDGIVPEEIIKKIAADKNILGIRTIEL